MRKICRLKHKPGQAVVEYAGALVVASMIVISMIPIATLGMSNVYNSLMQGLQTFVTTQVNNLH